jgi:hypothetical protein
MESRIYLSIVVTVVCFAAFSLWHRSGYMQASKRAVIFERDAADTQAQDSGKAGYEPYFTKANPIPNETK